ncbi:MAG TPA: universal stress protein [Nitrososphaeraceae archaeon]
MSEEKACAKKILVAIDGSEQSMKAADYAISLADKFNSKLVAVHVIDLSQLKLKGDTSGLIAGLINPLAELEGARKESLHWINNVGKIAQLRHIQFASEIIEEVVPRIGGVIVNYAEKKMVDLIVIGTRGQSGFKKLLIGSVASDVLHYAHCPVMIVK